MQQVKFVFTLRKKLCNKLYGQRKLFFSNEDNLKKNLYCRRELLRQNRSITSLLQQTKRVIHLWIESLLKGKMMKMTTNLRYVLHTIN